MTNKRFSRTYHDDNSWGMKPDQTCFEQPQVTMKRLLTLEQVIGDEVRSLEALLQ